MLIDTERLPFVVNDFDCRLDEARDAADRFERFQLIARLLVEVETLRDNHAACVKHFDAFIKRVDAAFESAAIDCRKHDLD